eukprot:scaffold421319_cov58-Attheya_sp.AAC.2
MIIPSLLFEFSNLPSSEEVTEASPVTKTIEGALEGPLVNIGREGSLGVMGEESLNARGGGSSSLASCSEYGGIMV